MKLKDLFEDKILTFSNILSLIRIISAPFIGYFMYMEHLTDNQTYMYYQLIGFAVIIFSDFFDGYFARLLNQVTKLGQFLDPLADKISALSIGSLLVVYKGVPLWLFLGALAREILVVIAGLILFSKKDIEVKPNIFGKLCAGSLAIAAIIFTISLDHKIMGISVKNISIGSIVLFYVLGGILYIKTYSGKYFEN